MSGSPVRCRGGEVAIVGPVDLVVRTRPACSRRSSPSAHVLRELALPHRCSLAPRRRFPTVLARRVTDGRRRTRQLLARRSVFDNSIALFFRCTRCCGSVGRGDASRPTSSAPARAPRERPPWQQMGDALIHGQSLVVQPVRSEWRTRLPRHRGVTFNQTREKQCIVI